MANKYIVAPGLVVYINNKPFAICTGFGFSSSTPMKPITGIDQVIPTELAPTVVHIRGSLGLMRTHGDGGLEGQGMAYRPEDLPWGRYFTITIVDRVNRKKIFQSNYCVVTDQNWNAPARGMVTGNVQFQAITWGNETQ
jgi:hypothetical protein